MKTIQLFAFLILASATQSRAMEENRDPISPEFNYFDKVESHVDCSFGVFFVVSARHLPTMRTYGATLGGGQPLHGYYQEKGAKWEQRVALDESHATAIFSTLIKIFPDTPHSEKKPLLDQLHASLNSGKQNQK